MPTAWTCMAAASPSLPHLKPAVPTCAFAAVAAPVRAHASSEHLTAVQLAKRVALVLYDTIESRSYASPPSPPAPPFDLPLK